MTLVLSLVIATALQAPARPAETPQAPPAAAPRPAPGNPVVVVATTLGDFTVELYRDRAPVSAENFLQYVTDGFFSGTIFHRVVPNFVIQGGGLTTRMQEKPTRPPIQNEATNGLRNLRGTLSMARTRALRSATSQFYVNLADNVALDHRGFTPDDFGYAVFGRVIAGMDVVDAIAAVKTASAGPHENVPVEPVVIKSVTVRQ